MSESLTILYAGTYERDYARNQQVIRLFRRAGHDVDEIHAPIWGGIRDKTRGFGGIAGLIGFIVRLMWAYVSLIIRMLPRLRTADAVVIGYIGQLDMLVLGTLARVAGTPVLFNLLVTLTDTMIEDRRLISAQSITAYSVRMLDWLSLRVATLTIVDTPENGRYLEEAFGIGRNRWRVLDVGADEEVFREIPRSGERSSTETLRVFFYGKMIPLHGIDVILGAIERLTGDPDVSFEIIGSGQLEGQVRAFLERNPEAPVTHRRWVAYRRLPQRIAVADCVLGIFGTSGKSARVVPNKVCQAMAGGVPIITRDSPAIRRILTDEGSALLIPPGDSEALANAIRRLRDPALRDTLASNARAAFLEFGSDEVLGRMIETIMGDVLAEKRTS